MLKDDTKITVTNRDNGTVGYTIPDLGNLHRNYQSKEKKIVTMEELRKLSYLPGGLYILKNCLILDNEEAIKELLGEVEPEYFYSEKEIRQLLQSGSLAQLQDCLDFAPTGVIDLVKQIAVETELNDINKRQAIYEKTGFNVTKAIEINHETEEETVIETKTRRAAPVSVSEKTDSPARRTAAPKYKVTSIAN